MTANNILTIEKVILICVSVQLYNATILSGCLGNVSGPYGNVIPSCPETKTMGLKTYVVTEMQNMEM